MTLTIFVVQDCWKLCLLGNKDDRLFGIKVDSIVSYLGAKMALLKAVGNEDETIGGCFRTKMTVLYVV